MPPLGSIFMIFLSKTQLMLQNKNNQSFHYTYILLISLHMFRETHVNMNLLHEYLLHYRYLLFKNMSWNGFRLAWYHEGINKSFFFLSFFLYILEFGTSLLKFDNIKTQNHGHTSCTVLDTHKPHGKQRNNLSHVTLINIQEINDPPTWITDGKSRAVRLCWTGWQWQMGVKDK